ncbi:hypothetical protein OAK57_01330 [Synechococcus sp. AH-551-N23]|nr:hypothetical protein [Synechococcus sp. AH-551-N23]
MTVIATALSRVDIVLFSELFGSRCFHGSCRNQQLEFNRRKTIEASADIESWFYLRARAIADGMQDLMQTVSLCF